MTLRCIAGIEKPSYGSVEIDGETVFDSRSRVNTLPRFRRAGYLFQSYALFPTMTVTDNIRIASRGAHTQPRASAHTRERRDLVAESVRRFRLEGLEKRYPSELSGGQKQRVALARMLASEPRIIMLDEPFSALDAWLRRQVADELASSLSDFPGSILFVSHDRDEVYRFCERIIVLDEGRIVREGTRDEVFDDPRTVPAARLTGCRNIAPAIRTGERRIEVPDWGLTLETARPVSASMTNVGIRAHYIRPATSGETVNCFDFSVERRSETPFSHTEYVTAQGRENASTIRKSLCRETGDNRESAVHTDSPGVLTTRLCIPSEHLLLLE
jgi:molybdate transport system ATP-binding protein